MSLRYNFLWIALCAVASVEAASVITRTGRQLSGPECVAETNGAITLLTYDGQRITFQPGQFRSVFVDRPAQLDQAQGLLAQGRSQEACTLLKQVQHDYRFLNWDVEATRLLADALFNAQRFAEAAQEYAVLRETGDATAAKRWREALLKSGDLVALRPLLEEDIAGGDREAAARAYLLRGDLFAQEGRGGEAQRDYWKAATFFRAQSALAEEARVRLGKQEEGK